MTEPAFVPAGYTLLRPIDSRGGTRDVHLARRDATGETVAVKFLRGVHEDDRRRFWHQDSILTGVEHPNVVRLLEIGEGPAPEVALYCVMEYLPGRTLRDRTAEFRSPDAAVGLVRGLALALDFLYAESGCVHRDLRPENVMFREDGTPCLIDFGLARAADSPPSRAGVVVNPSPYASPEQRRGEAVEGRSDVWSLGVILHELLAGRLPQGPDLRPSRHRPEVSARLDQIILGCLRPLPRDRYDAAGLAAALASVEAGRWPAQPAAPRPPQPGYRIGKLELKVHVPLEGGGVRFRHGDGVTGVHRDRRAAVPADAAAVTKEWIEWRAADCAARGVQFTDGAQVRLDGWGMAMSEGRFERVRSIHLRTSVTNYFATQRTHVCLDWSLPDARTLRQAYGQTIDSPDEPPLANALAVNLSVVTRDRFVYVARRGARNGLPHGPDPAGTTRVPMVSGTASPEYDLDEQGRFDPFLTAVREAKEEALSERHHVGVEDVTFFGLGQTHGFLFPFLFGELRLDVDSSEFEQIRPSAPGDVVGKDGVPLTVEAVVPWIERLYRHDEANRRSTSHTAILSLYQSLVYAFPDRIAEVHRLLGGG